MEETKIYHIDKKYRIVFEQAASTKGTLGFKVEANGDDMARVEMDIEKLYDAARFLTIPKEIQC